MDHYPKPESHHHHSANARSSWFRQTPHHHRPHRPQKSKSVPQSEVGQNKSSHPSNDFLRKVVSMIVDQYNLVGEANLVANKNQKLIQFEQPAKLEEILDLKINQDGLSDNELLELCEKVIKYSVKTTHPHFYNQLYGGCDQYGIAGSWLSDALNTSQATYEISPVFTIIEKQIIEFCGSKCGWQKDQIDGIFSPGGSMSNFYGMIMARFHKFPESKKNGILSYNQMVAFCSDNAHYSMFKSAIWMGMGSDAIIKIKTDDRGRMIPSELEKAIEEAKNEGKLPFCVVATAGTTVLSAFDPFRDISKICKTHGLWMHIDGALGATFLLSSKYRSLLDGVQEADSLAWNLHKLAGVPLQCSLFLTRHRAILRQCNSLKAEYLFQNDKYYDAEYDSGDKSIQCGRKVDSLKAWLTLCSRGEREWEHLVDNLIHMNRYITDKLRNKPGFKLVLPHFEGSTVSFWYIPESMRNDQPLDPHKLHKVCPIIKSRMMSTGRLMINYNPLTCKNLPNFFRLSLTCIPPPTMEDMDFIIDEIDRLGKDITIE